MAGQSFQNGQTLGQFFEPLYLLIKSTRKKAGALHLGDGLTGSGTGMSMSMREWAKQALTGCTGETDDEDE